MFQKVFNYAAGEGQATIRWIAGALPFPAGPESFRMINFPTDSSCTTALPHNFVPGVLHFPVDDYLATPHSRAPRAHESVTFPVINC